MDGVGDQFVPEKGEILPYRELNFDSSSNEEVKKEYNNRDLRCVQRRFSCSSKDACYDTPCGFTLFDLS
ncbi:hypothetical protein X801_01903, partial [Opisthorchis viverrini]